MWRRKREGMKRGRRGYLSKGRERLKEREGGRGKTTGDTVMRRIYSKTRKKRSRRGRARRRVEL